MVHCKKEPSGELVPVDDRLGPPYIVRRDRRIVSALRKSKRPSTGDELRSFNNELKCVVHTANEVVDAFQDGES